jgi:BirA family biotin operon repressor/biotin-[acetyl-CoA-carboxylase] ligase
VLDPLGPFEAIAKEMTKTGELVVETNGQRKLVDSGEVSVRGIYGYV